MNTELRLYYRRFSRHHHSLNDYFNEIRQHFKAFAITQQQVNIPISPSEVSEYDKRGILTFINDGGFSVPISELRVVIPTDAIGADRIIAEDFGSPVYGEFVVKYNLDREPA